MLDLFISINFDIWYGCFIHKRIWNMVHHHISWCHSSLAWHFHVNKGDLSTFFNFYLCESVNLPINVFAGSLAWHFHAVPVSDVNLELTHMEPKGFVVHFAGIAQSIRVEIWLVKKYCSFSMTIQIWKTNYIDYEISIWKHTACTITLAHTSCHNIFQRIGIEYIARELLLDDFAHSPFLFQSLHAVGPQGYITAYRAN
ncbi:hypothetical protein ACJX0J_030368 [Zea mays]